MEVTSGQSDLFLISLRIFEIAANLINEGQSVSSRMWTSAVECGIRTPSATTSLHSGIKWDGLVLPLPLGWLLAHPLYMRTKVCTVVAFAVAGGNVSRDAYPTVTQA